MFDELWAKHPHTTLTAMGPSVGLPEGQMGNSEVGHLNLGAGAIVPQDLARIDAAVQDGTLAENEVLQAALRDAPRVHYIGLVSDGGVHSSDRHLKALIELAAEWGIDDLVVHAFTDGRDTSPTGGAKYLADVQGWMQEVGAGRIGSVIGRYFAMDRDQRWDRIQKAYDLLVHGRAEHHADSGAAAAQAAYDRERDRRVHRGHDGRRGGEDPPRRRGPGVQLPPRPHARDHAGAERPRRSRRSTAAASTSSRNTRRWPSTTRTGTIPSSSRPSVPALTIGEVISREGRGQLHVAETEKYPHVTYFFNGGEEKPYEGEVRELVPSPRDVPTYDFKPEMSAREATDAFVEHFEAEKPAFSIINFANPDMVGHTGVIPAAVKAVETVDECLGRVVDAVHAAGGACLVTADHGNCDHMLNEDGSPNTAHSLNPVPFIVTAAPTRSTARASWPTSRPRRWRCSASSSRAEMTGRSLLG